MARRLGGERGCDSDRRRECPAEEPDGNAEDRAERSRATSTQPIARHERHVGPRRDRKHHGDAAERQTLKIQHATVVTSGPGAGSSAGRAGDF
jgi:hypothetical protein